jgi:hypothetical protein
MFAAWLVIFMDGVACDAVAVCERDALSCEATIVSCEAEVRLSACLNEGSAYGADDLARYDVDLLDPIYVLGCSTTFAGFEGAYWPESVDLDRASVEGVL